MLEICIYSIFGWLCYCLTCLQLRPVLIVLELAHLTLRQNIKTTTRVPKGEIFEPTTPALWVKPVFSINRLNLQQFKMVHYTGTGYRSGPIQQVLYSRVPNRYTIH